MAHDTDNAFPATAHSMSIGRGTSCTQEAFQATWVYDTSFGIIHDQGCRICRNYMMHVSDAELEETGTDSYSQAVFERDAELRRRFVEGFRRGRNTQQQHDSERLKAYRTQRDEARALQVVYKLKLEETEELVVRLRDELLALQIAYDELRTQSLSSPNSFDWISNVETASERDSLSPPSDISDISDIDPGRESLGALAPKFSDRNEDTDTGSTSDSDSNYDGALGLLDEEEAEVAHQSMDETVDRTVQPTADGFEETSKTDAPGPIIQLNHLCISAIQDVSDESDEGTTDTCVSISPPSRPHAPSPRSPALNIPDSSSQNSPLADIRTQMELAHRPDRQDILARVRSLVAKAQKTPSSRRTEVQRVLLAEWRRPPPLSVHEKTCLSSAMSTGIFETVYVDASGTGVGFVFGNYWQAWRLQAGWMQRDSRDIQWAEAVAVELGIRLLIQAGYSGVAISLCSDNLQVVNAISGIRGIGEVHAQQVLANIKTLCTQHQFRLDISWVAGELNPADAPSRLRYDTNNGPPRFPHEIDIPQHLQGLVLPYVC